MNSVAEMQQQHINRSSGLPLYLQIYELLRRRITSDEWQPGDMLPTETALLEKYDVSRATVRQALDALVQEGLIYRERGRGTFVAHPTVEQGLVRIVSFTEDMRQRGFEPGTEVLSVGLVQASEEQARALQVPVGEELVHIERLRLADNEPMSIEASFLVHRLCPNILSHDYAVLPLRDALENDYGIRMESATQTIRAFNASPRIAQKLGIRKSSAILVIERISRSQYGVPVEFLQVYHRGDRYVLYNELRG
ncbi:MAG: GntR family transcriptional regulator [Caldilineales bacterium]|nr:GntR family transcriptional regulator [Caldilineales bacterium]